MIGHVLFLFLFFFLLGGFDGLDWMATCFFFFLSSRLADFFAFNFIFLVFGEVRKAVIWLITSMTGALLLFYPSASRFRYKNGSHLNEVSLVTLYCISLDRLIDRLFWLFGYVWFISAALI